MPLQTQYQYDPAQFGITGMSPGYLQSIMEDIQRRGRLTKGQAIGRGTRAGMQYDDPSMQLAIQSAIGGTQREMGQTVGRFAFESYEKRKQREHERVMASYGRGGGYQPPSGADYAAPYTQPTAMGTMGGTPSAGMGGIPDPGAAIPDLQQRVQQAYNVPQPYQPPVAVSPKPREAYRRPWMRT